MLILSYNTLSVALDITGLGANFGLFDEMGTQPLLAVNLFKQSQHFREKQKIEDAIHYGLMACNSFTESSEYWLALAGLYQQSKNRLLSIKAALNSYVSNWGFGVPHDKVLYFLKQGMDFSELSSDPVIQKVTSGGLDLNFGGTKTNHNYPMMKECIDAYFSLNQPVTALKLYQNYAFSMYTETSAFQERYDFRIEEWKSDFKALCLKYLNDSRSEVTLK
ncbi:MULTISPECIES: tetratricopeptide repeat-containing protein [Enterobacterales]|uniref:Tetratricopeptide repeat-containing protein n=4 Tax=Morganellaceae TaxID=1903414 RepID=A0AAD2VV16_PRORE|nr:MULTISPECIES: tetratricopeptide repeat-containing protein [Enterobacterales]QHP74593.1 tetratricopeptide repeat-containing protein [Proteus vulgaris]WOC06483.1 tetratricopeptide repeat-containing protein [Providencia sp. PROV024]ELL8907254.1 tetratricopeptide repeat-containing protein [Proteus mirabilis]ELR5218563.1 tetratricopeptide repeat-containing protein [Providencia rettgeri]ELR5233273.1 tetratricopeptide repeat-containing protein [Providencia rettgeri]